MKRLLFTAILVMLVRGLYAQPSTSPNIMYVPHPTRVLDATGHLMASTARCGISFIVDSTGTGSTDKGLIITIIVNADTIGVRGTDSLWIALGNDTTRAVLLTPKITGQLWGSYVFENIPNPVFIRCKGKVSYPLQRNGQ